MFNLLYNWIDLDCPSCGYNFDVMVMDIKLEEPCFCHNCKKLIHLVDADATFHTGLNQVDQAVKDLEKALKNMFK